MMGSTLLVACFLVVTSAVQAHADTLTCAELCKSIVNPRLKTRRTSCDCSSGDGNFSQDKELEANGIYYEPSVVYTMQRLSFISPPFYIINPTLKTSLGSTAPKVIKKRKLSHYIQYDGRYTKSPASYKTAKLRNEINKRPLYLDVDVQDPEYSSGRSTHQSSNKINFKLSENDFMECVNLYKLAYSKKSSFTDLQNIKEKQYLGQYILTEPQIIDDIKKKCSHSADVVRESLQEIKSKWGQFKAPCRNTESINLEETSVIATHNTTSFTYFDREAVKGNTDNTSLLQYQKGELGNTTQTVKISSDNEDNELANSSYLVDEEHSNIWPNALIENSQKNIILNLTKNDFRTEHSLITTLDVDDSVFNYTAYDNDTLTKNRQFYNSNHKREKQTTKMNVEVEQIDHLQRSENNVTDMKITQGQSEGHVVQSSPNKSDDKVNRNKTLFIVKEINASKPNEQSDIIKSTKTLKNQKDEKFSTLSYLTEVTEVSPTYYDSATLKYEMNEFENNEKNQIVRAKYDSSIIFYLDTAATESASGSTRLMQNNRESTSNEGVKVYTSLKKQDAQLPLISISSLRSSNGIQNSRDINIEEQQLQVSAPNEDGDYYGNKMTTPIFTTSSYENFTVPIEESSIYSTEMYSNIKMNTDNNINNNKSISTRSTETTINNSNDNLITNKNNNDINTENVKAMLNQSSNLSLRTSLPLKNSELERNFSTGNKQITSSTENNLPTITNLMKEELISDLDDANNKIFSSNNMLITTVGENINIFSKEDKKQLKNENNDSNIVKIISKEKNVLAETVKHNNKKNITESSKSEENYVESVKLTDKQIHNTGSYDVFVVKEGISRVETKKYHNSLDYITATVNTDHQIEYSSKGSIMGKLFFVFNETDIPARFVQKRNGELFIGIDGTALCTKLNSENSGSLLINIICNCLWHHNCTNSLI